jgi:ubiquinone/menaquinone biosynthesis C-methylase UbiE
MLKSITRHVFNQVLTINDLNFLEIGCGNSEMAEQMYLESGKKADITSIDYSQEVINVMKKRHPERADKYLCMDARKMDFKDESFDYIVDKCGALGAILAQENKTEAIEIATAIVSLIFGSSGA